MAWMPFHYAEGANVLTDSENLDPVCMIPGYKQVGIRIEKVSEEQAGELTQKALNHELIYFDREAKHILWYQNLTGQVGAKDMMGLFGLKQS